MPLLYVGEVCCPHCDFRCRISFAVEVHPPPDAQFKALCPKDKTPLFVPLSSCRRVEELPPGLTARPYPPPIPPKPRWWQFWKR